MFSKGFFFRMDVASNVALSAARSGKRMLTRAEKSPSQLWTNWTRFLLEPVDGVSLAIFRILFFLVMTVDMVRYFQ